MEALFTKPALSVIDEELERNTPLTYHLIISIGLKGASCCLINDKNQTYAAVEQINFMNNQNYATSFELFEKYYKESVFFNLSFKTVTVVVISESFTLVPQALFDQNNAQSILTFTVGAIDNSKVEFRLLSSIYSYLLFAVPDNYVLGFAKLFGKVTFLNHAEVLIAQGMIEYKNSSENIILAHIQNGNFELMAVANHKMVFFNSFKYVSTEDVAYYTLMAYETLKFNPEEITLKLCGEIEKKSTVYSLLYKYIRNIEFISSHRNYKFSGGFNPLPSHFFFNIINAAHCVL